MHVSWFHFRFKRVLLADASTAKPTDKKFIFPLPDTFELIPAATVGRLSKLAETLDSCTQDAYIRIYADHRSEMFKALLKKIIAGEDGKKKLDDKIADAAAAAAASVVSCVPSFARFDF